MNSRLLVIKIIGRSATVAVYIGRELQYSEVLWLASSLPRAEDSLVGFVSSLIEHFKIDSAASPDSVEDTRAEALTSRMLQVLRERVIPHWVIGQTELLAAYGEVPLRTIAQLRSVVGNYWPHIIDEKADRTSLDAAALGLYLQTERMLSENSQAAS